MTPDNTNYDAVPPANHIASLSSVADRVMRKQEQQQQKKQQNKKKHHQQIDKQLEEELENLEMQTDEQDNDQTSHIDFHA